MLYLSVSAQKNPAPFTATPPTSIAPGSATAGILSFSSSLKKERVLLSWSVSANEQTNRFELERSEDGNSFSTAGLILGTDKAGIDSYQFLEKDKSSKTYYYRLKIISKSGAVQCSPAIMGGPEAVK
jgi:hypothetical protein